MSMVIALVGGGSPLDTSTLNHKCTVPQKWYDSVEFQSTLVTPPGTFVSLDLATGTYRALPRLLEIEGFIEAADMATLESNAWTLMQKFGLHTPPVPDREISFPDDADVIGVGRALQVLEQPQDKGAFVVPAKGFIIRFEMRDPRRYDISGGRPGTALP